MAERNVQRLIRVRAEKRAKFTRRGVHMKKRIADSWRRPSGQHNKQRRQLKAKGPLPTPGYGSPVAVRGFHPSGYEEVRVFNPADLAVVNPETQVVRIAGAVGRRKREAIALKALESGITILNLTGMPAKEEENTEEVANNE
jgi:large subunit ribosomal protein L32e